MTRMQPYLVDRVLPKLERIAGIVRALCAVYALPQGRQYHKRAALRFFASYERLYGYCRYRAPYATDLRYRGERAALVRRIAELGPLV